MSITAFYRPRTWQAALLLGLFAVAACGPQMPPPAAPSPMPAGVARVWFYRDFFPEDSGDIPLISMNGNPIGYAGQGISYYRNLPPGDYHVTVDSVGVDLYQSQDVTLAAGQDHYIKIMSLPSWASGSGMPPYRRGTYYVAVVPQQRAAAEMLHTTYFGGN